MLSKISLKLKTPKILKTPFVRFGRKVISCFVASAHHLRYGRPRAATVCWRGADVIGWRMANALVDQVRHACGGTSQKVQNVFY